MASTFMTVVLSIPYYRTSGAVFRGYGGTVVTAEINADGSAEFAEGKVTISSTGAYTWNQSDPGD